MTNWRHKVDMETFERTADAPIQSDLQFVQKQNTLI